MQITVYNCYKKCHIFKTKFIGVWRGREAREEADSGSYGLLSLLCIPHGSGLGLFLCPGCSRDPSDTMSIRNPGPEAAPCGTGR